MALLEKLMDNEEFVAKMEATESEEELKALLEEYNAEVPVNESEELNEDELKDVAGGAVLTISGLVAAFAYVWNNGGGKIVTSLINKNTINAYYICCKANSDYKKGNMYRTYSEKKVRNAINTLDKALAKFGY